jgi:CheY-like chemotaxis protein
VVAATYNGHTIAQQHYAKVCLQETFIAVGIKGRVHDRESAMLNRKHKILVVDDDLNIASTLAVIFKSHRYDTATANSGEEAIEVAYSFQPDCIVSDVMMGAMNGIEAAMVILDALPECKVLFMSGNAACRDLLGRDLLVDARAKGFNFEVLQKPVPPPEMLAKLSQVLTNSADPYRKPAASEASAYIGTQIRGSRHVGR